MTKLKLIAAMLLLSLTAPGRCEEQQISIDLQKDATKAIPPHQEAVARNPDAPGPRIALAAAWWQVAQQKMLKPAEAAATAEAVKRAKEQFNEIIAKWPQEKLAYAYLADIATYEKDFAGGEKALKTLGAVQRYKDSPEPALLLGDFYVRFGKMDIAEPAYAEGLAKSNNALPVKQKVAVFYAAQRKFDQAIALLKDSDDPAVVRQLVEALIGGRKLAEAEELLSRLLAANPHNAHTLTTLAFVQLLKSDFSGAIDSAGEALEIDPRNQMALLYRGLARMRQGPTAIGEAIRDLTAARDLGPNHIPSRVALADAYIQGGEPERACRELEAVVKLQPTNKDVRMRLVEMYGRMIEPRWEDAERLIKEAEQLPEFRYDPDWHRVEMSMWLARKQPEKALASIREAMQLAQAQPERLRPLTQDYVQILLKLKKYRDAAEACTELLKDPEVAETGWWAYHLRGLANASIDGKRGDAISDFDKALEITSKTRNDDGTLLIIQSISDSIGIDEAIKETERRAIGGDNLWGVLLGSYTYLTKQDYAKATELIEKVLAERQKLSEAERSTALSVAGSIYMLSGKYPKAEAIYQELVKLNPNDLVALNNLSCLYAELLDPPQRELAVECGRKALDLSKSRGINDPNVMDTYGWALVLDGQLEEGIKYLRAAIDAGGPLDVHYHLGLATLDQGHKTEARAELEQAKKMLDAKKAAKQPVDAKVEKGIHDALERIAKPER